MTESLFELKGACMGATAAWLAVSGPDAESFLQGQATQDLRGMQPGNLRRSLWLNLKGKVLGETQIIKSQDTWWLWSAYTPSESLRARLKDFIIADDVTVTDARQDWQHITIAGADTLRALDLGPPPSPGTWRTTPGGGMLFNGRPGLPHVWELALPATTTRNELPKPLPSFTPEDLTLARLSAGQPAIPQELGADDLPQEAGLEQDAISFSKGCYLGQEIMARLHAMGRVRRQLLRIRGAGTPPLPGTHLLQHGKRCGEVRAAAATRHPDSGWRGLGMVNLLGLDPAGLDLPDGRIAHFFAPSDTKI